MAIYKMVGGKERLEEVAATSFGQEGLFERSDLQRILRDQPEVLEEGLFIITEEFSNWEGSGRSIDLLGLDASGRLVVIELKRGETGEHMDLQAIRYAAMVSTITLQQAIDAHQAYLNRRAIDEEAEGRIGEHLENNDIEGITSANPRIVLVSEGFSAELTTCALWLNNRDMDVTCVRMQPHRSGTELLVETSQIIPLPEAHDYLVKVRAREEEQSRTTIVRQWQFNEGGNLFQQRISSAKEKDQAMLNEVFDWASDLERDSLAILSTTNPGGKCNLLVSLPTGHSPSLVRVRMEESAIRLRRDYFAAYAPNSISRLQELIGPRIEGRNSSFNVGLYMVNADLLAALREAYREANGLPVGEDAARIE